jgi:hypothetical protein
MGTDFLRLAVICRRYAADFVASPLLAPRHTNWEELAGSYRYQLHLYDWMESNYYGRSLADDRYI